MKSSRIICFCTATLQELLTLLCWVKDDQIRLCSSPWQPRTRGVHPQWEWQQLWCHPNEPCHNVLENDARRWGTRKQRSMETPLQAVLLSVTRNGQTWKIGKVCNFTTNNETQMVFCSSWLLMLGYFCFSYYTLLSFFFFFSSTLNFNLAEWKTTLQKQVNRK